MSKVAMTEVTMENRLLDTPYVILLEIFRSLPKDQLIEISRLCSKFRYVAGDARLWKDVSIIYRSIGVYLLKVFDFEDLYSEPWPVKVIDLSQTKINPPVSLQTEQMIKVAKLNLSSVTADEVTIAAILAKYQCTELYLDGDILRIAPEAFSKQTGLEVLSVRGVYHISRHHLQTMSLKQVHQLLAPIFKYLRNLKTLDLSQVGLTLEDSDISSVAKTLPISLEKLFLLDFPEDSFLELLAGRIPNLRELKVLSNLKVNCPSLLKFQFLEVLTFTYCYVHLDNSTAFHRNNISDLYKYLAKFPALKTVYFKFFTTRLENCPIAAFLGELRTMLQQNGIIVEITDFCENMSIPYVKDNNSWEVSGTVPMQRFGGTKLRKMS